MKRLISICFLVFFVVIGNAQVNTKPKLNELNQDQLNLALLKSKKSIKTGKVLTFVGLGITFIGTSMIISEAVKWALDENPNGNKAWAGYWVAVVGETTMWIGIPVWIVGASKKKKITLELIKFNPKGSASINGIGLKIRF